MQCILLTNAFEYSMPPFKWVVHVCFQCFVDLSSCQPNQTMPCFPINRGPLHESFSSSMLYNRLNLRTKYPFLSHLMSILAFPSPKHLQIGSYWIYISRIWLLLLISMAINQNMILRNMLIVSQESEWLLCFCTVFPYQLVFNVFWIHSK